MVCGVQRRSTIDGGVWGTQRVACVHIAEEKGVKNVHQPWPLAALSAQPKKEEKPQKPLCHVSLHLSSNDHIQVPIPVT